MELAVDIFLLSSLFQYKLPEGEFPEQIIRDYKQEVIIEGGITGRRQMMREKERKK